jgi:hypothetical protein
MQYPSLCYGMEMGTYSVNSPLFSCLAFKCKFSQAWFLFIVEVEGGSKINIVLQKLPSRM